MSESPAFQFYAADYLADENVQVMSLEQEGAYIRLMAYCWREGSIPNDTGKLSRLCKTTPEHMAELMAELMPCFIAMPSNSDRLIHPRLEEEREKQAKYRAERSESGRRGAAKRWKTKRKPTNSIANGLANGSATNQPMAKNGSSSSSLLLKEGASPPTTWDFAEEIGIPRTVLGKAIKDFGEEQVSIAIYRTADKRPAEPVQFFFGCLKPKQLPAWKMSNEDLNKRAHELNVSTQGKTRDQLIRDIESKEAANG